MPVEAERRNRLIPGLVIAGLILLLPMLFLVVRIVWEETWLTLRDGPQMVGFSLAHGYLAPLLLTPVLLLCWMLLALITAVVLLAKGNPSYRRMGPVLAAAVLLLGVLTFPAPFWQWLFLGSFSRSRHVQDLITSVAAEGYTRTVRGYLNHGVPVNSRNYEGSTAAFAAAAGGSVPVLQLLAARGADLNAVNLYGDSPLEAAIENHEAAAIDFLRQHGAKQIKGTEEQHQAAARWIVQRSISHLPLD